MSLNTVTIMGRLTRDPEVRYTQSNTQVASFSLAVDRDFGEKQTDFINVVSWKKTAEFAEKYLFKGMLIVVTGRLQTHQYADKQGQNRTSVEVVADHIYFAESKQKGEKRTTVAPTDIPAGDWNELDGDAEDLPF